MNYTRARWVLHGWLLAALLVALGGCAASSNWQVVNESGPPSALQGALDVAVNFDYSTVLIEGRSEADWVAAKTAEDPEYPTTYANLKADFETGFIRGIRKSFASARPIAADTPLKPNTVFVQAKVNVIEIGAYIPFALPPTTVNTSLIWHVAGQATDEIMIERERKHSKYKPSVFQHIGQLGEIIGTLGGDFLKSKQGD